MSQRSKKTTSTDTSPHRRQFISTASAAAVAGAAATTNLPLAHGVHNSVDETLRVGLIGCGGRGRGAVLNAAQADKDVKITALADAFADRIEQTRGQLKERLGDMMDVDDDHCFDDFDCYQKLIDSDVDVVLLASPPAFRPAQMEAAAAAGKHIFCEKPIAVDSPGVRRVMDASLMCAEKGLSLVSGLCWRYDTAVRETMNRVKSGAIGDIRTIQSNYLTGELWHRGENEKWSDMEYQMRNWLYFTWLSGDLIAEQHIHTLDKGLWLMDDEAPVAVYGSGGRQKRTDERWGNVYDHMACCFEWENGVKMFSHCRQMSDCFSENECHVFGTTGTAHILKNIIENPAEGEWRFKGKKKSMYDVEHDYLFKSIRDGEPINNGDYMCKSTMMAIMGRQACYTGQRIEWDDAWNDDTVLGPKEEEFAWGDYEPAPVAVPGRNI